MRAAVIAMGVVVATPTLADVAVPQPPAKKTWRDACVVRLDAAAKRLGLEPGARLTTIPLVRDDGAPNAVQYVEYGHADFTVTAGEEPERRPDATWTRTSRRGSTVTLMGDYSTPRNTWFRRLHDRFGKMEGAFSSNAEREFKLALDDCLKMGEAK